MSLKGNYNNCIKVICLLKICLIIVLVLCKFVYALRADIK